MAIGLYPHAHGGSLVTLADKFAVGISKSHGISQEYTKLISDHHSDCISFPSGGPELQQIFDGFERLRGLPVWWVNRLHASLFEETRMWERCCLLRKRFAM